PRDTVVLGTAACSAGAPRWWSSDGSLVPGRYARSLHRLAAGGAAGEPYLRAAPYSGRGATPAWPARRRRIPALTIGCLDSRGVVPRSHQRTDTSDRIDVT